MKKYLKWEYTKRLMDIIQFSIVIFGVVFTIIQIKEIANNQLDRKYDSTIRYYDKLNLGVDRNISIAIEHNKDILKPKGKFTSDQLDDYIDDLYTVGEALSKNLLDEDTVCSNFYSLTFKAHNNIEISNYIKKVRVEEKDDSYFAYFDYLYDFILDCQ